MRTAPLLVLFALSACDGGTPVKLEQHFEDGTSKVVARYPDQRDCERARVFYSARCCGQPIGASQGLCEDIAKKNPTTVVCEASQDVTGSVRCVR